MISLQRVSHDAHAGHAKCNAAQRRLVAKEYHTDFYERETLWAILQSHQMVPVKLGELLSLGDWVWMEQYSD